MKMDEKYSMNTELDPEVVKVRDKIISKIGNKPLDEVNSIIKKLLNDQTDEVAWFAGSKSKNYKSKN